MTGLDVCEAIAEKIAAIWPERILYRDFCPADHKRPSGYLYITREKPTDLNALLVRWDLEAQLELFCSTDAYDHSSTEELRADQERVLAAFPGPLAVGNRYVSLSSEGDGMETGSAFVKFSAAWTAARPGGLPGGIGGAGGPGQPPVPLMQEFEVNGAVVPADPGKDEV